MPTRGYGVRRLAGRLALAALCWAVAGAAAGPGLSVVLEARAACGRALNLLLQRQRTDGSWAGDPLITAQVVIALANAPSLARDARAAEVILRGAACLRRVTAETAADTAAQADPCPTEALAAAMTALARLDLAGHRETLAHGREVLSARLVKVPLVEGVPGLALASLPGGGADEAATCAAVDALLVTEGLRPVLSREDYAGLAAFLREQLRGLTQADAGAAATPAGVSGEQAGAAAALARALLSLGARPDEAPLTGVLDGLARSPPGPPAAAFLAAEALALAEYPDSQWRERYAEALLGTQQADGGWPGPGPDSPREGAAAFAVRCLQVALGRHLAEGPSFVP